MPQRQIPIERSLRHFAVGLPPVLSADCLAAELSRRQDAVSKLGVVARRQFRLSLKEGAVRERASPHDQSMKPVGTLSREMRKTVVSYGQSSMDGTRHTHKRPLSSSVGEERCAIIAICIQVVLFVTAQCRFTTMGWSGTAAYPHCRSSAHVARRNRHGAQPGRRCPRPRRRSRFASV